MDESHQNFLAPDIFYDSATNIINATTTKSDFAIVSLDFDNFNFINDLFGYKVGDEVLKRISNRFSGFLSENEIFSKIHSDHFLFLIKFETKKGIVNRLTEMTNFQSLLSDILPAEYSIVSSGGIALFKDYDENVFSMIDKANFARKKVKGTHKSTFLFYDIRLANELDWRKVITTMMEFALINDEFEMYLQPQVFIQTGEIVGSEALVRWNNPKYGLIYPDQFLPILEENGFIKEIDFTMLKKACEFIKASDANKIPLLPIAVNFSKIHIRSLDFVDNVLAIVKSYDVPTNLIELEFTENCYSEDFLLLTEIISSLKYYGFIVSLDDFGSAYSSLNYLKDLPLDIIKIDKSFFGSSSDKSKIIIAKMIELIKSLRMTVVMEGVETSIQASFLQKLSCDFGQGYLYAKPMPVEDYIAFLKQNKVSSQLKTHISQIASEKENSYDEVVPKELQLDNWELRTLVQNIDMGLMKGKLTTDATVQYINDIALEYLGYTREEFKEIFNNKIVAFTHPDDIPIILKNQEQLIKTGKPLKFQTRAIRKDGKVIILKGNSSCVIDSQGTPIGIYAFRDVTDELSYISKLEQELAKKNENT
ncbi:MAG: EAL domain-containing protein [Clostridia bacterium]